MRDRLADRGPRLVEGAAGRDHQVGPRPLLRVGRLAREDRGERALGHPRPRQDARTQFYLAYAYYRHGWGRVYNDDALFAQGLEAVNRAIALGPAGGLIVADQDLRMTSADELKAALDEGLRRDPSDFNPFNVFRPRK